MQGGFFMYKNKKRRIIISVVLVFTVAVGILFGMKLRDRIRNEALSDVSAKTIMTVEAFARQNSLDLEDYPVELLELLSRNPETKDFVLSYPLEKDRENEIDLSEFEASETVPLFLQWDKRWGYEEYGSSVAGLTACGPVCLSMCAYYLTGNEDMSPDNIIEFAKENGYCTNGSGSLWTLISEGGEELGLDVEELPLVKKKIVDNLENGNPVICVMGEGHFTTTGHFIVLTGIKNGEFTVNDPNSIANSEKTWSYEEICDEIKNLWAISL